MYNHTAIMGRKHIGVTQGVIHFRRLSWPESRNMANGNEEMRKWRNKKMRAALGKTTDHGLSHFSTHTASQHGWLAGSFLCGGYSIIHKLAVSCLEASSAKPSWKRVWITTYLSLFMIVIYSSPHWTEYSKVDFVHPSSTGSKGKSSSMHAQAYKAK